LCFYRPLFRDLAVDNSKLNAEQKKGLVESCPKKVFDIEDISGDVVLANVDDCNGCRACINYATSQSLQRVHANGMCPGVAEEKPAFIFPDQCRDCGEQLVDAVQFPKKRLFEWHRFTVETNGSLDAAETVQRAIAIVENRLAHKAEGAGALPQEFPSLK
jgi:NAD-dependent dihydropyrimidine dehydrogenase PreA subunit